MSLERRNEKDFILEYVLSLKRRELDYEVSKYLFNTEVIIKYSLTRVSQKFDYFQKQKLKGRFKRSYIQKKLQHDKLVPIPKWSIDGRYSSILLTKLGTQCTIIPILGKRDLFMISSKNYSVTTTLHAGIAQLALLEYYYKEDFLPNQL